MHIACFHSVFKYFYPRQMNKFTKHSFCIGVSLNLFKGFRNCSAWQGFPDTDEITRPI